MPLSLTRLPCALSPESSTTAFSSVQQFAPALNEPFCNLPGVTSSIGAVNSTFEFFFARKTAYGLLPWSGMIPVTTTSCHSPLQVNSLSMHQ